MTICIGVKVNDCLVFVADSASTVLGQDLSGALLPTRVYNHADKIFNLYRGLPVAGMTCGLGNFGSESISTITKGLRVELEKDQGISPNNYTIELIVRRTFQYFRDKYKSVDDAVKNMSTFEFFVGGYSADDGGSEVWKFDFRQNDIVEPQKIADINDCRVLWAGQPEACVRLVLGFSSATEQVFRNAGLDDTQASELLRLVRQASEVTLIDPAMPTSDAIELGQFLAQTTASFVRFLPGADTVGGDLDIATVTKYEGFKWIKRKHFYPQNLNGENDHVKGAKSGTKTGGSATPRDPYA